MNLVRKRELVMTLAEAETRRHMRKVEAAAELYAALKGAVEHITDKKAKALAKQVLKRVDTL